MAFQVGTVVEGTVTAITKFGAFVELPDGTTGLVHISEIADTYVTDINQYIKIKDKVRVKVINIDQNGRVALSIKQADPSYHRKSHHTPSPPPNFEDKLAKFMKESEERQHELKKNLEGKRGAKGTRS